MAPSKTILATFEASDILEQGRKWVILEKQSTTARTESCFLWIFRRPSTKSMLSSCHKQLGTGSGVFNQVFCFRCFASWQVWHLQTCLVTSRFKLGQKNRYSTASIVFSLSKCLAKPPASNSQFATQEIPARKFVECIICNLGIKTHLAGYILQLHESFRHLTMYRLSQNRGTTDNHSSFSQSQ